MFGLALEGGGVRGAFHMGAVRALLEEGYEFGGIAGTSIGALNGAVIAQGDFEAGYKLWKDMDAPLLFDIEEEQYKKLIDRKIDKELLLKLAARMKDIIENKGIDTSKMRQIIGGIVNEEKLRKSDIDFGLVTVSITDLKPLELYKEDIPEGRMVDYLMASAGFPGFKLNPIESKYYIDGGFYDNCPINLLARKGYKEIIAVRTLGPGIVQNLRYRNVKVINIFPSEDLGMPLDFSRDLIMRNLKMGYYDAMRSIKGLRGRKYYIIPENEDRIFNIFNALTNRTAKELGNTLRIKGMSERRMLFESIIPQLANIMELKRSSDYQDIFIGLLELFAYESGADKYKIYTLEEFFSCVKSYVEGKNKIYIRRSGLKQGSSLNKKLLDALKGKNELREAAAIIISAISALGIL